MPVHHWIKPKVKHKIDEPIIVGKDYHSFANTDEVVITHVDLNFAVNFNTEIINATNTIRFKRKKQETKNIILDTRDLTILKVSTINNNQSIPLNWRWG